jgi:hypothetical protein
MEKRTLLAIMGFGALVALVCGLLLVLPKDFIKNNMRYIVPLPPLAVAVYVYISKVVEIKFIDSSSLGLEIAKMSLIVGFAYFLLAILLYGFVKIMG